MLRYSIIETYIILNSYLKYPYINITKVLSVKLINNNPIYTDITFITRLTFLDFKLWAIQNHNKSIININTTLVDIMKNNTTLEVWVYTPDYKKINTNLKPKSINYKDFLLEISLDIQNDFLN